MITLPKCRQSLGDMIVDNRPNLVQCGLIASLLVYAAKTLVSVLGVDKPSPFRTTHDRIMHTA